MNENPDADARLYDHVVQLLRGHARMLADERRNAAFFAALRQQVTPGARVLDIGTGTGLWAIAAAKLGAQQVVAIERDPLLLGLIRALAEQNGVADRLQVIVGESRQIQLPGTFDLVMSETVGNLGLDEDIWSILADARQRFLKPGGNLLPSALSLRVAPACFQSDEELLPKGVPLNYEAFDALFRNIPAAAIDREKLQLLGASVNLFHVDFARAAAPPNLQEMTATWPIEDLTQVNCVAAWPECVLSESVVLNAMQTSSWSPVIYRFRPFTIARGQVDFKLTLTNKSNFWSVRAHGGCAEEEQSYSPASAASTLLSQMRCSP